MLVGVRTHVLRMCMRMNAHVLAIRYVLVSVADGHLERVSECADSCMAVHLDDGVNPYEAINSSEKRRFPVADVLPSETESAKAMEAFFFLLKFAPTPRASALLRHVNFKLIIITCTIIYHK